MGHPDNRHPSLKASKLPPAVGAGMPGSVFDTRNDEIPSHMCRMFTVMKPGLMLRSQPAAPCLTVEDGR